MRSTGTRGLAEHAASPRRAEVLEAAASAYLDAGLHLAAAVTLSRAHLADLFAGVDADRGAGRTCSRASRRRSAAGQRRA
jgi:hypothetical protein